MSSTANAGKRIGSGQATNKGGAYIRGAQQIKY